MPNYRPKTPRRQTNGLLIAGVLFVLLSALGLLLSYPFEMAYPFERRQPPTQDFVIGHGFHRQYAYAIGLAIGVVFIAFGLKERRKK